MKHQRKVGEQTAMVSKETNASNALLAMQLKLQWVEVPGVEPGSGEGINELSTCLAESIIFSSTYPNGRALVEDGSPNS